MEISILKTYLVRSEGDFINGCYDLTTLSSNYYDLTCTLLPNILGASIPIYFFKTREFQNHRKFLILPATTINTDITINTDLGVIVSDMKFDSH